MIKDKVTIRDVAKLANCSIATASRVLSGKDYPVSESLKQSILQSARSLNYIPNLAGRLLKNEIDHSIGIIIPSFQNPFYVQLIMGIETICTERNFDITVLSSQRSPEIERKQIDNLISRQIKCLMLVSVDTNPEAVNKFISTGGKVCIFEANFDVSKNVINAKVDTFRAGQLAMDYLISMGHSNIAFLSTPLNKQNRILTLNGCKLSADQNKVDFTDSDVYTNSAEEEMDDELFEFITGKKLVDDLLANKKYTAIIAVNDLVAFGVISQLKHCGYSIPADFSVISFDNIPYSSMVSPALTTVDVVATTLAKQACIMMVNCIETGSTQSMIDILVQPNLVIRETVRDMNQAPPAHP